MEVRTKSCFITNISCLNHLLFLFRTVTRNLDKIMKKTALLFIALIALTSCKQAVKNKENLITENYQDSLTRELIKIHKQGYINGFSVAVVTDEEVVYQRGIGYANIISKENYTENTIQNIGSVSKTFIGVAIMKAQEMGKLHLDDPINKYLPFRVYNPFYPNEEITLRHLATHTSTIVDTEYYNGKAYILKENMNISDSIPKISETLNPATANMPLIAFLEKLLSEKGAWYEEQGFLNNKPGEIFEYSNIGASLAAAVLEAATDTSFKEFTTENILKPLGMTSSGWSFDDVDLSMHTTLYARPQSELPYYSLITYPDGGLITSVSDMAKYLRELLKGHSGNGTLLTPASYSELFKEQLTAENFLERDDEDPYDDEYNTGIFMGFSAKGYIGHTGGDPGIATYMFFNPRSKTAKILMINTTVMNSGGVDEFFSIWNALEKYETKLGEDEDSK